MADNSMFTFGKDKQSSACDLLFIVLLYVSVLYVCV